MLVPEIGLEIDAFEFPQFLHPDVATPSIQHNIILNAAHKLSDGGAWSCLSMR